jgi:8-oxo-dGTP pyrophosphatase MutT (NUDIX family)
MSLLQFVPGLRIETFVMIGRVLTRPAVLGASVIAEDEQGRVLLVRHSYTPDWSLPGGGVNQREPPEAAALRECQEEAGLSNYETPEFFGLYTRKVMWFTNIIAVYRLRNVRIAFRPNLEIREVMFCDPSLPPPNTTPGTLHRLAELTGKMPRSPHW